MPYFSYRIAAAPILALWALGGSSLAPPPVHAEDSPPEPSAAVVIHADAPGPIIDRHIYGQFAEHLGHGIYDGVWVGEHSKIPNVRGIRTDVVTALRNLHVPVVRWPGGCFADEYHWRDGIGPRAARPVTLNTNWGGVPESNEFGTHEFLDFVGMIGAEAYINGNLGTGSAREMAEWLQYMTSDKATALTAERSRNGHPQPWKIAYFAVGNEAWGCGGNMSVEHYVDEFRRAATFLKAPAGARPVIIASGGHDEDSSWSDQLSSRGGPDLGAISYHYYTTPGGVWALKGPAVGFGEDQWISTLKYAQGIEDYITRNSLVMDRNDAQKKIALDVDEWGTWYDPEAGREPGFLYQQNTLRDALVAAVSLNIFHQHADRVRMTNIAQMVNVLQSMILTDGPHMVLTPTYHVFRMFIPFQDATLLPTDLAVQRYTLGKFSIPAMSVSAARALDGSLTVALVNLNPRKPLPVTVGVTGTPPRHVSAQVLTASDMDAHNTVENPTSVQPAAFTGARLDGGRLSMTLPPKSIVVARLD